MRELLVDFYRQNTGRKPEAIIFYRTDVGADVHDEVGRLLSVVGVAGGVQVTGLRCC